MLKYVTVLQELLHTKIQLCITCFFLAGKKKKKKFNITGHNCKIKQQLYTTYLCIISLSKTTVKFTLNPKLMKFNKHPQSPPDIFNRQNTLCPTTFHRPSLYSTSIHFLRHIYGLTMHVSKVFYRYSLYVALYTVQYQCLSFIHSLHCQTILTQIL